MLFSFLFTLNALKIHLCRLYVCVEICIFFFDVCNRTSQHSCLYSFQVYFFPEAPECSIANILYKKDNLTSNKRVFSYDYYNLLDVHFIKMVNHRPHQKNLTKKRQIHIIKCSVTFFVQHVNNRTCIIQMSEEVCANDLYRHIRNTGSLSTFQIW